MMNVQESGKILQLPFFESKINNYGNKLKQI